MKKKEYKSVHYGYIDNNANRNYAPIISYGGKITMEREIWDYIPTTFYYWVKRPCKTTGTHGYWKYRKTRKGDYVKIRITVEVVKERITGDRK